MSLLNKRINLLGIILMVFGGLVFLYAQPRNCIIRFITEGRLNTWTVIEIGGGILALIGIIIIIYGLRKE
ncbi:MAG: hypothetical protein ACFFCW_07970 [Candidatus Hodarchaeota archaeon]